MTTKIKIDLLQGFIEAEGSEEFVRQIYGDFKESLESKASKGKQGQSGKKEQQHGSDKNPPPPTNEKGKKAKKARSKTCQIVQDLDLSGGGQTPSLRDFYAQFKAKSNFDRNLIFLYYLKNKLSIEAVTIDYIFTCYRNINGLKIPGNLEQSLIDTRARKGWIDTSSLIDIKLNVHGINYLEHDIEKV